MNRDFTHFMPWFVENLEKVIMGLYFSSRPGVVDRERWIGYLLAWSSLLIVLGGNPEKFMAPDDIQLLKKAQSGR